MDKGSVLRSGRAKHLYWITSDEQKFSTLACPAMRVVVLLLACLLVSERLCLSKGERYSEEIQDEIGVFGAEVRGRNFVIPGTWGTSIECPLLTSRLACRVSRTHGVEAAMPWAQGAPEILGQRP
jgi:hypothetical protein